MTRTDATARNDGVGDGTPSAPAVEWHLARDGRQYGPVTAVEIAKLVELGHLQDGDLVWRAGFADWRPMSEVRAEILPQRTNVTVDTLPPYTTAHQPEKRAHAEPAEALLRQAQQNATMPQPTHHGTDWKERLDALASRDYDAPIGGAGNTAPRVDIGSTHRDARLGEPANRRAQGTGGTDLGADPRFTDPRFVDTRFSDAQTVGRANDRAQPDARLQDTRIGGDPRTGDPRAHQQTVGSYRAAAPAADPRYIQPPGPAAASANERRPSAPQPRPQTPNEMMLPQQGIELEDDADTDEPPRRRGLVRALVAVVLLGSIGAGTGYAYMNRATLMEMFETTFSKGSGAEHAIQIPEKSSSATARPNASAPDGATLSKLSSTGGGAVEATPQPARPAANDQGLMATPLWASIASQFPDWAAGQRTEIAKLRDQRVPEDTIDGRVMEAIVELRRKNASDALASPDEHVIALATAFLTNLKALSAKSTDACYGFISRGETSPAVLPLIGRDRAVSTPVLAQLDVVMTAIAAGKKQPVQYVQPFSSDYTVLSDELIKRGWSRGDLELFSNPQALSTATPEQVCRLVTGWFEAQLGIPKKDIQLRLLRQSLRPVVSG